MVGSGKFNLKLRIIRTPIIDGYDLERNPDVAKNLDRFL
jgi:hypothetical protein